MSGKRRKDISRHRDSDTSKGELHMNMQRKDATNGGKNTAKVHNTDNRHPMSEQGTKRTPA